MVVVLLLERTFVLLKNFVLGDGFFEVVVAVTPFLDLSESGFEDAVDPIVFDLQVVDLGLVVAYLVFQVPVL